MRKKDRGLGKRHCLGGLRGRDFCKTAPCLRPLSDASLFWGPWPLVTHQAGGANFGQLSPMGSKATMASNTFGRSKALKVQLGSYSYVVNTICYMFYVMCLCIICIECITMPHSHFIMYICFILTSPQHARSVPPSGSRQAGPLLFFTNPGPNNKAQKRSPGFLKEKKNHHVTV